MGKNLKIYYLFFWLLRGGYYLTGSTSTGVFYFFNIDSAGGADPWGSFRLVMGDYDMEIFKLLFI